MKKAFLAGLLLFVLLTSCDRSDVSRGIANFPRLQSPDPESVDFIPGFASSEYRVYDGSMLDSVWIQQYRPLFIEAGRVISELSRFIEDMDTSWVFVDSVVQVTLNDWAGHIFYYAIATNTSNRMLWYRFLGDTSYTIAEKEAIQFYVNLALQYGNPDGEMQAEALKILSDNGFWSTARVKSAADSAHNHAYVYLQTIDPNSCNCEDDEGSTAEYIQNALAAQQAKLARIQSSLSVLDSLRNL
jgi:hypothetical protein